MNRFVRYSVILVACILILGTGLHFLKLSCLTFRQAGFRSGIQITSHGKFTDSASGYTSSRIIRSKSPADSLIKVSYLHFTRHFNAMVSMTYHPGEGITTEVSQYNSRSRDKVFLPLPQNRQGNVLLNDFIVDGDTISYTYPPFAITMADGQAALLFRDDLRNRIQFLVYDDNCPVLSEPQQQVPMICGTWEDRHLVYSMAFSKGHARLKVHHLSSLIGTGKNLQNIANDPARTIIEHPALPQLENIGLFSIGEQLIATIPYRGTSANYLDLLDVKHGKILQELYSSTPDQEWIVLSGKVNYLDLALVDNKRGTSSISRFDPALGRLRETAGFDFPIRDAWESPKGDLFLLTSSGLIKCDQNQKPVKQRKIHGGDKIYHSYWKDNRYQIALVNSKHKKIILLDDNLVKRAVLKHEDLGWRVLQLDLVPLPKNSGKSYAVNLILEESDQNFTRICSLLMQELPEGFWENLSFRGRYLYRQAKDYLVEYSRQHPMQIAAYIILICIAIMLSLIMSQQLVKNKLLDISSLLPVPNNDKKYLNQILKLLRKPNLATAAILNIDIVDFSSLVKTHQDNPDLLQRILIEFYQIFIEEASRNGGTIGKIMGDGIIAVFGWPDLGNFYVNNTKKNLHDAIITAQRVLSQSLTVEGISFEVRLGMTIGDIYIGYYGNSFRRDYMAVGQALELSELIQKASLPQSLSIDKNVVDRIISCGLDVDYISVDQISYNGDVYDIYRVIGTRSS